MFQMLVWQLQHWRSISWLLCQCIFEFIVNEKWSFSNWGEISIWEEKHGSEKVIWMFNLLVNKAKDNFLMDLHWGDVQCTLVTVFSCLRTLMNGLYILYEWTLGFVWMDFRFCMNAFGVQLRSFLLAGGCTGPHHICNEYDW